MGGGGGVGGLAATQGFFEGAASRGEGGFIGRNGADLGRLTGAHGAAGSECFEAGAGGELLALSFLGLLLELDDDPADGRQEEDQNEDDELDDDGPLILHGMILPCGGARDGARDGG